MIKLYDSYRAADLMQPTSWKRIEDMQVNHTLAHILCVFKLNFCAILMILQRFIPFVRRRVSTVTLEP